MFLAALEARGLVRGAGIIGFVVGLATETAGLLEDFPQIVNSSVSPVFQLWWE